MCLYRSETSHSANWTTILSTIITEHTNDVERNKTYAEFITLLRECWYQSRPPLALPTIA